MRISRFLLGALMCLFVNAAFASEADSLRIVSLEQQIKKETKAREALSRELKGQNVLIKNQSAAIDSLRASIMVNANNIKTTADEIGVKIDSANNNIMTKADKSDVQGKSILGVILIILLAILGAVVYILLRRRINRGNADVEALRQKAEQLNEKVLSQFSQEVDEMKKISASLASMEKTASLPTGGATTSSAQHEPDHTLIKTLADRITFMEMTLYKMDPKVKGYKQLTKSIAQMKDNLLANGYELVEMLGKPYNDGMKAVANFNDDDEIEPGQRIITAIIKPQINYKGQMIQAAQITVSQNVD